MQNQPVAEGIEQLEKQLLLQHREYRSKANEYDVKSEQHEKLQQVRAPPTTNRKHAVQCMRTFRIQLLTRYMYMYEPCMLCEWVY